MTTMKRGSWIALSAGALLLGGCGGVEEPAGTGSVAFTTWGEEYIEQEIPASDFADGWRVQFSAFRVVLGTVIVRDEGGNVGARMVESKLFDHHAPGVKKIVTFTDLEAKPWSQVSYEIRSAAADTTLGEGASGADLDAMKAGGIAVYAEGEAQKDAVKKTFRWGFGVPTAYVDCRGDKDGRETLGVLVTNGGIDDVEITIHGDHLFYDDLQSPNAALRFDAIASADVDMDGEVTLEELFALPLLDVPPGSGPYGTGSASDVNDLGAFVTALSRTIGHFRGEGECFAGKP
jgi:hypothetical protein